MKKITIIIVFVLIMIFVASPVEAQGLVGCRDDCKITDLLLVVIRIMNYMFSLASLIAMLFIVWAGWNMITAGGNEEKISKAKETFSHAVIGFFLVIVSFILLDAITMALGGFTLNQMLEFILKK